MFFRSYKRVVLCVAVMLFVSCAMSANAQEHKPVTWSIQAKPTGQPFKAGDRFNIQVVARIERGWHLYSLTQPAGGPLATRISLPPGQPFRLNGRVKSPVPTITFDEIFNINTEFFSGSATFIVPVVVGPKASAGKQRLRINAFFQTCNDSLCLPPATARLAVAINLAEDTTGTENPQGETTDTTATAVTPTAPPAQERLPSDSSQQAAETASPPPSKGDSSGGGSPDAPTTAPLAKANGNLQAAVFEQPLETNRSWLSFIWLAMVFGALSLLTPCVFPMVPITVSYFTNHAAGQRGAALRGALIYSLGIILTFTALGVALSVLFGAAGINKFAANPYINLIITGIFLSFALSLFGAFNLQAPSGLLTKLESISRSKDTGRIVGLLLMGLTFSLTSFTCTAPFVGTLLVMASQGRWIYPIVGMLAFSTVFAFPFFLLALAPQLVSHLPKSGGWLNSVKIVMGLLEIAAAMKFLSNVDLVWHWGIFTREVILAIWVAIALLITFYLLGKFQLTHDSPIERIGAVRLLIALVTLSLGFYLLTGLFGRRLGELESFLPPVIESSAPTVPAVGGKTGDTSPNGELTWITNDYEGALKQAKFQQKPLFIDFTGYTCTNCRWMEVNMFTRGAVKEELTKYVRVRLYTDGEGQAYESFQRMQQERFGTVALPLYAVMNVDGNALITFPGLTRDMSEFVSFLRRGQERFAPGTASRQPLKLNPAISCYFVDRFLMKS